MKAALESQAQRGPRVPRLARGPPTLLSPGPRSGGVASSCWITGSCSRARAAGLCRRSVGARLPGPRIRGVLAPGTPRYTLGPSASSSAPHNLRPPRAARAGAGC